jgi:hypothetical protein
MAIWTPVGEMIIPRSDHTATLLMNGKVLVAGGITPTWVYARGAELYDPGTRRWSATASMATNRASHTATLLPNGKVLVAGGTGVDYFSNCPGVCETAEVYDPATGVWTATGRMIDGRIDSTATLLPSGKVLVAGGDSPSYSSAEVYDPDTGVWSATSSMASRYTKHTATVLPSGKILVAGGESSYPSAELYRVPDIATTWYFAEGYTGEGFDEYLTILNPNSAPAPVTITYYLGGGRPPVEKRLVVPATARSTVAVHDRCSASGAARRCRPGSRRAWRRASSSSGRSTSPTGAAWAPPPAATPSSASTPRA